MPLFLVALTLAPLAAARVLDPIARPPSRAFEAALHAPGIDIQRAWEAEPAPGTRARLAPLDGRNHGGLAEPLGLGWVESAQAGRVRLLAAYLPADSASASDFRSGWAAARVEDRLILTHTPDDAILAQRLREWRIEGFDESSRAACVAFAADAVDQAAIDIGWARRDTERRSSVYAHPALRSSALGESLLWSDQMPYAYLSKDLHRRSDRSVIVDRAVRIRPGIDGALAFDVDFDVRLYKRGGGDTAEIIDTRRYTASSETNFEPSAYIDVPGVEGEHRILVADAGDHGLSRDLAPFARAAAWVSLSRWVLAEGGQRAHRDHPPALGGSVPSAPRSI